MDDSWDLRPWRQAADAPAAPRRFRRVIGAAARRKAAAPVRSGSDDGAGRRPTAAARLKRVVFGGAVGDVSRAPRYILGLLLAAALVWGPISAYLAFAPERFTSSMTLILPGAGANASVNLAEIGQASSYATSPYASSSVSPTVSYKTLLGAQPLREAAAARLDRVAVDLPEPRVRLIDQTSLLVVEITGATPDQAQAFGGALLGAFLDQLNALRRDEVRRRETSFENAIADYRAGVAKTRAEITRLQRDSGLASVDQHYARVAEASALQAERRRLSTALARTTSASRRLRETLGVSPALAAATLRFGDDPELKGAAAALTARAGALAEARARYGPRHPERTPLEQAYAGAERALRARAAVLAELSPEDVDALSRTDLSPSGERAALLSQLVRIDAERAGLAAELERLTRFLEEARRENGALIAAAARLDDLNRDHQVAEAVFASALARTDTTKADLFASYPLVQVLEPPSRPGAPSSPRRGVALGAGVVATLLLIGASVLLWLRRPLIERLIWAAAA